LEGVGETLTESGELVDRNLECLLIKVKDVVLNPELVERIEEKALNYATELSWPNQALRHYKLVEKILCQRSYHTPADLPSRIEKIAIPVN